MICVQTRRATQPGSQGTSVDKIAAGGPICVSGLHCLEYQTIHESPMSQRTLI